MIRARVKYRGRNQGNANLSLRYSVKDGKSNFVSAYFSGGGSFGIGVNRAGVWKDLATTQLTERFDDYFEFAFAAVGDKLTVYVNKRRILEARTDLPATAPSDFMVGSQGLVEALFRDVEVQVLDRIDGKAPPPSHPVSAAPDSTAAVLAKAVAAFQADRKKASETLLGLFDRELEALPRGKGSPQDRGKMLAVVKAEKAAFERKGRIPFSAPMRIAAGTYLDAEILNRRRLSHAFDAAIDFHQKRKEAEKARELTAQKQQALQLPVAAVWNHMWAPGQFMRVELLPGGAIKQNQDTWTWSPARNVFQFKSVNPQAPGGQWIHTFSLSNGGKRMTGTNQLGNPKSAALIED